MDQRIADKTKLGLVPMLSMTDYQPDQRLVDEALGVQGQTGREEHGAKHPNSSQPNFGNGALSGRQ